MQVVLWDMARNIPGLRSLACGGFPILMIFSFHTTLISCTLEKNWGEALFGTVMDIPDKTKIRNEDSETRETMEEDSGRFRPNEAPKKGSTRVDPKVTIPIWVCSESEEGSQSNYDANQWPEES